MDGHMLEQFSRVVDSIYAAALRADLWPIAIEGIARLQASPKANFLTPMTVPAHGGFIFPYGLSESALETWDAKYRDDDVWFQAAARKGLLGLGQVLLNDDMMSKEEFEGSRHYREFLRTIDIHDICTSVVFDGKSPPALPTVLSVFRGHHDAPFDDQNRMLHVLLTSHVSRALGVMFKLRMADLQIASSLAALNRAAVGVLLFGERGEVVFANETASSILKHGKNGLVLRAGQSPADGLGWLKAFNRTDDVILQREIAVATTMRTISVRHFAQGVPLRRHDHASPLLLQFSALTPDNEYSHRERHAVAIAFLSDPELPMLLDPALLADAYRLTPAECVLAQEILSGESIKEISSQLGLSRNTIKSQLDAIFAKTGVHRQAQLVKLLIAFASPAREPLH